MDIPNSEYGAFAAASGDRIQPGLTKREYFAGLAMKESMYALTDLACEEHFEKAAKQCVKMADALLAALEEK